jgi:hypothetical protein
MRLHRVVVKFGDSATPWLGGFVSTGCENVYFTAKPQDETGQAGQWVRGHLVNGIQG